MSFRLFIYYCAIAGGWFALVGWAIGRAVTMSIPEGLLRPVLQGMALGAMLALGLGFVDGLWASGGRGMAQTFLKGGAVAVLGLVGGLVGAMTGQLLFSINEVLGLFGWTLMGLLIGASIGLYDTMLRVMKGQDVGGGIKKMINGVIGGLMGGLLGCLLFWMIKMGLGPMFGDSGAISQKPMEQLLSSSAWGFVALGVCIGLLIGLAQVILKVAWLRVELGFRPGRELILSKDETTIGRGEGCDIGLFGDTAVEKLHARIVQKKNRYLVADVGTPSGTFVNDQRVTEPQPLRDGDEIRVGKSVLRFGERAKRRN